MADSASAIPVSISSIAADLPDAPVSRIGIANWGGGSVDLHAAQKDYFVKTGAHDHHLICHCPGGSGRLVQARGGERHEGIIGAGSTMIMPAGMDSLWEGDAAMSLRIRLPIRLLDEMGEGVGSAQRFELANRFDVRDQVIERLAGLMVVEIGSFDPRSEQIVMENLFVVLGAHLWRAHNCHGARPPDCAIGPPHSRLAEVTGYIVDNLDANLTLGELAAIAGMSRFHFTRKFKQHLGIGPARYVQRLRIERAKALMLKGDTPLADVALAAGFADQSHFTRRFKNFTGETPGRFQHRARHLS